MTDPQPELSGEYTTDVVGAGDLSPAAREYLLAFADDEHLMGQRHTEWIGVTPFLEEDLAFASIGQDELGHAANLYAVLVGDDDQAIDRLAFRRPASEYRSCWLVEYETSDWAEALVRHWLYDTAEAHRWELLTDSAVGEVALLVPGAQRDEAFHRRHADGLLDALLDVDESRRRIEYAVSVLWPLAQGLFDGTEAEATAHDEGVVSALLADRLPQWRNQAAQRFPTIDWEALDGGDCAVEQQHRTVRHGDFEAVYANMREVMKFDPDAVW